jgi:hypothetical protein
MTVARSGADGRPFLASDGAFMETDWYNRAEAIQQRITQLKDSL